MSITGGQTGLITHSQIAHQRDWVYILVTFGLIDTSLELTGKKCLLEDKDLWLMSSNCEDD